MGSYLSEPVTEKISSDESNDKLNCGASSMQGWRISQEDAHNCILDFDTNTSFFSVYDGHGGHEVALYCSQELPEFLKQMDAYKNKDFKAALQDAFLKFDGTIATPEVIAKLKEMASEKEAEEESDDEENVNNLYEEAAMPIEQVIEKYTSNLLAPVFKNLQKDSDKVPVSPLLKAKRVSDSTSDTASKNIKTTSNCASTSDCSADVSSSSNVAPNVNSSSNEKSDVQESEERKIITPDSTDDNKEICTPSVTCNDNVPKEPPVNQNGEVTSQNAETNKSEDVTSSSPSSQENGGIHIHKKGKGKALMKTKGAKMPNVRLRPKRNAQQLYSKLLDFEEDSEESEDEEDKTFEGPTVDSSDEDVDGVDTNACGEGSEESSIEEEEEEEEDEDDDLDDEDESTVEFAHNMREEPGSDSGCTAVVALLHGVDLYVANAGDSRCIVCRNGKAIEMSFDHKPEDEPERDRVVKAGGKVTVDGRVNGGLNLSRAIGDHAYKQNKALSDREQMITALPDVKMLTINPAEDEFMVMACDGIWNFMSSQEVVDFVKPRIDDGCEKLSGICEEMFDHCLAPNTMGDGTGCDNMTAIIIQFKKNLLKRSASPSSDDTEKSKRTKTEENGSKVETSV